MSVPFLSMLPAATSAAATKTAASAKPAEAAATKTTTATKAAPAAAMPATCGQEEDPPWNAAAPAAPPSSAAAAEHRRNDHDDDDKRDDAAKRKTLSGLHLSLRYLSFDLAGQLEIEALRVFQRDFIYALEDAGAEIIVAEMRDHVLIRDLAGLCCCQEGARTEPGFDLQLPFFRRDQHDQAGVARGITRLAFAANAPLAADLQGNFVAVSAFKRRQRHDYDLAAAFLQNLLRDAFDGAFLLRIYDICEIIHISDRPRQIT